MLNTLCTSLPSEPHIRRGHCSAIYESGFYIWHGSWCRYYYYDADPKLTIHRLDLVTLIWTTDKLAHNSATTPSNQNTLKEFNPLNCVSTCQFYNMVYGFGGHHVRGTDAEPFKNTLYALDLAKLTFHWLEAKGQVPCKRDKTVLIYYKNNVYLFGGWSYTPCTLQQSASYTPHENYNGSIGWNNELFRYDLSKEEWFYQPLQGHYPPPTAASTFTVVGDKAYLIAGRNPPKRVNDIYILYLITMVWSHIEPDIPLDNEISRWPSPRSSHAVSPVYMNTGVLLPNLVLFGGLAPDDSAYEDFWIFDITKLSWQKGVLSNTNTTNLIPRTWFAMGSVFNSWSMCIEVVLFGGIPGPLGSTSIPEVGDTTIVEIGISSLKRLSFIVLAHNVDKCLADASKVTTVFYSNLIAMKEAIADKRQVEFSLLSRYNPFIPFPCVETALTKPKFEVPQQIIVDNNNRYTTDDYDDDDDDDD